MTFNYGVRKERTTPKYKGLPYERPAIVKQTDKNLVYLIFCRKGGGSVSTGAACPSTINRPNCLVALVFQKYNAIAGTNTYINRYANTAYR